MTDKPIGYYSKKIMTRSAFIKKQLKSYKKQLKKLLPAKGYEMEYKDILDKIRELLC